MGYPYSRGQYLLIRFDSYLSSASCWYLRLVKTYFHRVIKYRDRCGTGTPLTTNSGSNVTLACN